MASEEADEDSVHDDGAGAAAAKPADKKPKRRGRRTKITIDHPQHGRIEVRHMTDLIRAVELDAIHALADASGPTKRVWIQMAKVGQWAGHQAGAFELNPRIFSEIVANFKATQNRAIPIDFEHSSESDPTSGSIPTIGAPAQGWVVDLDNRGAEGLWACVEWGDRAREYIETKQYKYISPAVRFGSKDRVTGKSVGARLTSAGLTNQPFLDGMAPLAATDRAEDDETTTVEEEHHMDTNEFIKKLEELSAANVAFSTKLSDVIKERDAARAEVVALADKIAKRDVEDLKALVDDTIATYGDKLPTSDADSLLALCKADQAAFRKTFPRVKPAEQHLLRDLTSKREVVEQKKATAVVASQEQLRDKYLAEGKTLEQACNLAFKEHKTLLLAATRGN